MCVMKRAGGLEGIADIKYAKFSPNVTVAGSGRSGPGGKLGESRFLHIDYRSIP